MRRIRDMGSSVSSANGTDVFRSHVAVLVVFLFATCAACAPTDSPLVRESWTHVLADLPAALLSVSGNSDTDVWMVGASDGDEALVLHYDGQRFERVLTGHPGALWWVLTLESGTTLLAGSDGTVLRARKDGTFTRLETPSHDATVFGLWGRLTSSLWAVGASAAGDGFIWRDDGGGFEPVEVDPEITRGRSVFKVWGRDDDDVWFVGDAGLALHYDGEEFAPVALPHDAALITVHGDDEAVYAVGGLGESTILRATDTTTFIEVTPDFAPSMNGVFATGAQVYAVGERGEVMVQRRGQAFRWVDTRLDLRRDYHAVWVDPEGGVWAVGGHIRQEPLVRGMLTYFGDLDVASEVRGL